MNRIEAIEYLEKLESLNLKNYSKYILYIIDKTKSTIKSVIEDIKQKDSERFPKEFKKFEEDKRELLNIYAKKDENGNVIIEDNRIEIENEVEFNELYVKLVATHRATLDKFEEDTKKLNEYVQEDISHMFLKINFEYIPEHLDIEEYSVLSKLIDEDSVKI